MFKKYKAYIICVAFLVALASSFFYGQYVQELEGARVLEKQRVEMQAKIDSERSRREEVSARFESKLDNLKIVNTTINKTIEREIEKQIYIDCKVPESGIQLINENADKLNAVRKVKK